MPITPDTKNWTWVLERACPECGFDAEIAARADSGRLIRENAARWQVVLAGPTVRDRPTDDTWSPLEYGCHVRDVYRIMAGRVELLLTEPDPVFANWDQDETAEVDDYASQDPAVVAAELLDAGETFAQCFVGLSDEQWLRPGRRSNGSRFTVDSLARYALHDVVHHLVDVPAV